MFCVPITVHRWHLAFCNWGFLALLSLIDRLLALLARRFYLHL